MPRLPVGRDPQCGCPMGRLVGRMMGNDQMTVIAGGAFLGMPARAAAQSFGIGRANGSFVRADVPTGTPSARFLGGLIRIKASPRVVLEGSLDTRTSTSTDGTERLRERPKQVSLLLYPARSTISPYIVAGYGRIRAESSDTINPAGTVLATTKTSTNGWHAGFGAELLIHKAHRALRGLPVAEREHRPWFVGLDHPQPQRLEGSRTRGPCGPAAWTLYF